jgi:aspartate/methionine/tyrosine aminotransferase
MNVKPSRRSQVEPFRVMEVLDAANRRAREGHPVFHLEAGQPSTMAPRLALEAASRALTSMTLGYTESLGVPMLRERISRHYHEAYGLQVSADRVIVTTGSSAAFVLAFLLAFDAGQSLAIANPGYPAYRNIAHALDLRTHLIDCGIERGFRMSARDLEGVKADGVLIASPSNPCGTVMPPDDIREIAAHCRKNGMALISDEIYHGLTYDCTAQTALAFDQGAIVINSFSKYYSMTGWRIGWMIVPQDMVASVERLTQNFYISPPTISQVAATAAMDARDELESHVARYRVNRDRLLHVLRLCGFKHVAPADGAFYLYAETTPFGLSSTEFSRRLLAETGVAATAGVDFDPVAGNAWIRFSYAGSEADVTAAAERLGAWCSSLQK